ncbi:MAG: hypothetical protein QM640_11620 [Niabella sp.]
MPSYIANVVLHQAVKEDYFLLDKELKSRFFSYEEKSRIWNNAQQPHPSAHTQYVKKGDLALLDIIGEVQQAAFKTGKKFSFTVRKEKKGLSLS